MNEARRLLGSRGRLKKTMNWTCRKWDERRTGLNVNENFTLSDGSDDDDDQEVNDRSQFIKGELLDKSRDKGETGGGIDHHDGAAGDDEDGDSDDPNSSRFWTVVKSKGRAEASEATGEMITENIKNIERENESVSLNNGGRNVVGGTGNSRSTLQSHVNVPTICETITNENENESVHDGDHHRAGGTGHCGRSTLQTPAIESIKNANSAPKPKINIISQVRYKDSELKVAPKPIQPNESSKVVAEQPTEAKKKSRKRKGKVIPLGVDEIPSTSTATATTAAPQMSQKTAAQVAAATAATAAPKGDGARRAPHIIVKSLIDSAMAKAIKTESKDFKMTRKRNSTIIEPASQSDHSKIMEVIRQKNISAYTYSSGVNTTTFRVMKGVHASYEPAEIAQEILDLVDIKVDVFAMTSMFNGSQKPLDMFRIKFASPDQAKKAEQLHYVLNQRVQWQMPHKADIIQCFRCQSFGHVSGNCNMPRRCVKCNTSHPPAQCELDRDPVLAQNVKAYCVNCGEEGHPASYKGCPVRKSAINKMKEAREAKQLLTQERTKMKAANFVRSTLKKGVSYADALEPKQAPPVAQTIQNIETVQTGQTVQTVSIPTSGGEPLIRSDSIFGGEIWGLPKNLIVKEMFAYLPQYRSCNGEEARSAFFLDFMFAVVDKYAH